MARDVLLYAIAKKVRGGGMLQVLVGGGEGCAIAKNIQLLSPADILTLND